MSRRWHCRYPYSKFSAWRYTDCWAAARVICCSADHYRKLADTKDWTVWNSPVLVLWSVFVAAYMPLVVLRVFVPDSYGIFDRYLLPVMPLATIGILTAYQRLGRKRAAGRTAMGFTRVAFRLWNRPDTRLFLAAAGHGSRSRAIWKGWGSSGARLWPGSNTIAGPTYPRPIDYNDPRIVNPPGAYQPRLTPLGFKTIYAMWPLTPVVNPDYVVVLGRHPDLFDTDVPPYPYACWLSPFHREIAVQVTKPDLARTKALAVRANSPAPTEDEPRISWRLGACGSQRRPHSSRVHSGVPALGAVGNIRGGGLPTGSAQPAFPTSSAPRAA